MLEVKTCYFSNCQYPNFRLLPKDHAALIGDINCVVGRIIDELVVPMRNLGIDLVEYVILKAILFFNPGKLEFCKIPNHKI